MEMVRIARQVKRVSRLTEQEDRCKWSADRQMAKRVSWLVGQVKRIS
jgi:NTP pyrophosphatase (non-canonical NTP hydrolase)